MPILVGPHKTRVGASGVLVAFLYGNLPLPPQSPAVDPVPTQPPVPLLLGRAGKFLLGGPLYLRPVPADPNIHGVDQSWVMPLVSVGLAPRTAMQATTPSPNVAFANLLGLVQTGDLFAYRPTATVGAQSVMPPGKAQERLFPQGWAASTATRIPVASDGHRPVQPELPPERLVPLARSVSLGPQFVQVSWGARPAQPEQPQERFYPQAWQARTTSAVVPTSDGRRALQLDLRPQEQFYPTVVTLSLKVAVAQRTLLAETHGQAPSAEVPLPFGWGANQKLVASWVAGSTGVFAEQSGAFAPGGSAAVASYLRGRYIRGALSTTPFRNSLTPPPRSRVGPW